MSTDFTHFDKLAFNRLFSMGPDGQETLMINSSGIFVGTISSTGTESVTRILVSSGTALIPSISFNGDQNTGFYSPSSDKIRATTGGADSAEFASGAVRFPNGTVASPGAAWISDPDTGFYHIGANNIGVAA